MKASTRLLVEWVGSLPRVRNVPRCPDVAGAEGFPLKKGSFSHPADKRCHEDMKELVPIGVMWEGCKDDLVKRDVVRKVVEAFRSKAKEGAAGTRTLEYVLRIAAVYHASHMVRDVLLVAEKYGIRRNQYGWRFSIEAFAREPREAEKVLQGMVKDGFVPCARTYNALLEGLHRLGYKKCQDLWVDMCGRGLHPNERTVKLMLRSCKTKEEVELCLELVKNKRVKGESPPKVTVAVVRMGVAASTEELKSIYNEAAADATSHRRTAALLLSSYLRGLTRLADFPGFTRAALSLPPSKRDCLYYSTLLSCVHDFIAATPPPHTRYLSIAEAAYREALSPHIGLSRATFHYMMFIYHMLGDHRMARQTVCEMQERGLRPSEAMLSKINSKKGVREAPVEVRTKVPVFVVGTRCDRSG